LYFVSVCAFFVRRFQVFTRQSAWSWAPLRQAPLMKLAASFTASKSIATLPCSAVHAYVDDLPRNFAISVNRLRCQRGYHHID
jgi:hypothetical protein